jgi:penicillin G amidase
VNARIAERGRFIAPEFLLLGAPEPWRVEHSLLWGKSMGLFLSGGWRGELERARLAEALDAERLAQLFPADTTPGRPDRLAWLPRFPDDTAIPSSASNAWALDAARSGSGAALLASDPHLGFSAPILWYLARIELPDGRFRAGATSPGVPLVVIGRNESLAWGFTTTHSDTADVFVERLVDADHYLTEDGPRRFTVRETTLRLRGGETRTLRVRETRNGPVISDLDDTPRPDNTVLSVAMAALAPRDTAAEGLLSLNRARSIQEARAAAALITSPPQNMMVADAAGNIGLFLTGRTPIRRAGDGTQPSPGHTGTHGWDGFVPFDAMPHATAPGTGRLVNANNRVAPPDHPVFLGREFPGDWRFRRIHALLDANPRPDAGVMAGIQLDNRSLLAEASLPLLGRIATTGRAREAQALLGAWNGEMAANLPQPLIWNAWALRFQAIVLAAAGAPADAASPEFLDALVTGRAPAFCRPDCEGPAARALDAAVADLTTAYGADMAAWRWGPAHAARFDHPLLRFIPGINALVRLEVPTAGDGQTVNRGGARALPDTPGFRNVHGAGLRLVADMASPDGLLAIIATGQSGHPMSQHWGDLLPLWAEGRMLRLSREPSRVAARIELRP